MNRLRTWVSLVGVVGVVAMVAACGTDPERAKKEAFDAGNRSFAQQKFGEAAINYRKAIQLDGKYGQAREKLADTYVKLGDIPNAYREYSRGADLLLDNVDLQIKATSFI